MLDQLHESVQRGERLVVPAACMLQAGQGCVAQPDLVGVHRERVPHQVHALRQVLFGGLQVVPLT